MDIFDPDTGGVRWRDGDGREYVITPTLDGERKMRRPA